MKEKVFVAARIAVESPREQVFHMNNLALVRVYLRVLLAAVPVLVLLMILGATQGANVGEMLSVVLETLGIVFLVHSLTAVLLSWRYPIRVSDQDITATDFWGRSCRLSWGEIETVTETRWMTLPYLKVASFRTDRPELWVPVFVTHPSELREAIRHASSPTNPLRQHIEMASRQERLPL